VGWAERTLQYLAHHQLNVPWLAPLRTRFGEAVAVLLAESPTVIHGEYYPDNILYRGGRIYPVDWESAALAAGVIDLASLTEGWPDELVRECSHQYQAARWPSGTPDGFNRRLWAARLYLQFRWLGDRPDTHVPAWRIDGLSAAGRHLGLV
jgi:thiamine kinase-like enzyme